MSHGNPVKTVGTGWGQPHPGMMVDTAMHWRRMHVEQTVVVDVMVGQGCLSSAVALEACEH